MGSATSAPSFNKSRTSGTIALHLAQIPRHQQYYHQFNEFRDLEGKAARQWNPAPGTEHLAAQQQNRRERDQGDHVEEGHMLQQPVIVDPGHDVHEHEAPNQEQRLLPPGRAPHRARWWRCRSAGRRARKWPAPAAAGANRDRGMTGIRSYAALGASPLPDGGAPAGAAISCGWQLALLVEIGLDDVPGDGRRAVAPCSPPSTRATTTISGNSRGAKPTNQALSFRLASPLASSKPRWTRAARCRSCRTSRSPEPGRARRSRPR